MSKNVNIICIKSVSFCVSLSNITHKFYWEKTIRRREHKPIHPMENDESLPAVIRGKHYDSWTDLARDLGYGE